MLQAARAAAAAEGMAVEWWEASALFHLFPKQI